MKRYILMLLEVISMAVLAQERITWSRMPFVEMTKQQVEQEIGGNYYVYSPPVDLHGIAGYDPDDGTLGMTITPKELSLVNNFAQTVHPGKGSGNITGTVTDHADYSNGKWFKYCGKDHQARFYFYTYYEFSVEYMKFENTRYLGNGITHKDKLKTPDAGIALFCDSSNVWWYFGKSGKYRLKKYGAEEIAQIERQKKAEELKKQKEEEERKIRAAQAEEEAKHKAEAREAAAKRTMDAMEAAERYAKEIEDRMKARQEQERDMNHIDSNPNETQVQHVVAQGEGLYRIAKKYNVSTEEILELNPIVKQKGLCAGQVLTIPKKSQNSANQNSQAITPVENRRGKSESEIDILDMNNSTPFNIIKWKVEYSSNVYDAWFSEESGLTTDNKRWTNGMSESMGWYALHRFNKNQYTCNYLHSANSLGKDGYGDNLGEKIAVRDCGRNTLPIEKGYFVLDLRDWQGYKPLYLPYSQAYIQSKWQRGMIKFEYR